MHEINMRDKGTNGVLGSLFKNWMGPISATMETDLPNGPGLLFIANHSSLIDGFTINYTLRCLGLDPVFLAAAGLWKIPIFGSILNRGNHIPVYRGTDRAREALEQAKSVLTAPTPRPVVMFPEGGIPHWSGSQDQPPSDFKTGAARLWRDTGVPVIPIAQLGARRVVSGGVIKKVTLFSTAGVRRPKQLVQIGAPIEGLNGDTEHDTIRMKEELTKVWERAFVHYQKLTS